MACSARRSLFNDGGEIADSDAEQSFMAQLGSATLCVERGCLGPVLRARAIGFPHIVEDAEAHPSNGQRHGTYARPRARCFAPVKNGRSSCRTGEWRISEPYLAKLAKPAARDPLAA
jgi:hypothetical protein